MVKMHNVLPLAPPQLTFTFDHPNKDWPASVDNSGGGWVGGWVGVALVFLC